MPKCDEINSFNDLARQFVTDCGNNKFDSYFDYVTAGIATIIMFFLLILLLLTVLFVIILIIYVIPVGLGNWFNNNRGKYWSDCVEAQFWPISWKNYATGMLLLFITSTGIVIIIVSLYWIGHIYT